jgi:hypothetical protein
MGSGSMLGTSGGRTEANDFNLLFTETRYVVERVLTRVSGPMYRLVDLVGANIEDERRRRPGTHRRSGRHRRD